MNLSSYVPQLVKEDISAFVEELLTRSKTEGFDHIAVHPGGKKIVENVGVKLRLDKQKLQPSIDVLRNYGNMSSPTVLFVMKQFIESGLEEQKHVLALAFGPGLTFESMLFEYGKVE